MDLGKHLEIAQANGRLPAVGALVFDQTRMLAQAVRGVRKWGADAADAAVTMDDHFHIGSCGKAMTATLLAMLVEAGALSWDTTPLDVMPELFGVMHPDYETATLRQLLTHRAGLPPYEEDEEYAALPRLPQTPIVHRHAFTQIVLRDKPLYAPGSDFRYSNAGYAVATAMMESVTMQPWEILLPQRLFQPLAMRAGFGWPAAADPAQPWGHQLRDGEIVPHSPHDEYQLEPSIAPAGDIHVALADYPRFLQMHLRGLAGAETLLRPETIETLHTPYGRSAIGWGVQSLQGHQVSVHTGSADTFFTIALLSHNHDMGVIIAANIYSEQAERACIDLLKIVLDEYQ